jgi:hypothetical protein
MVAPLFDTNVKRDPARHLWCWEWQAASDGIDRLQRFGFFLGQAGLIVPVELVVNLNPPRMRFWFTLEEVAAVMPWFDVEYPCEHDRRPARR